MRLGKIKFIIDRQRNYFYYINTLMIIYLFLDRAGWSWWYLFIIPVFAVSVYVVTKYIISKEFEYMWSKNPIVKEIREKVTLNKEE